MPVEIERAFVAEHSPDAEVLGPGVPLRQGYVASEGDVEVRLRIGGGVAVLTVKAGDGLVRDEVEIELQAADAEALWPLTRGRRLVKRRHRVQVGDHVAEVDVYGAELAGVCRIEVEFDSEAAAAEFVPPPWFGREVTGDERWRNARLARHGRPDGVEIAPDGSGTQV